MWPVKGGEILFKYMVEPAPYVAVCVRVRKCAHSLISFCVGSPILTGHGYIGASLFYYLYRDEQASEDHFVFAIMASGP